MRHLLVHIAEHNCGRKAIDELWFERLLDLLHHGFASADAPSETNVCLAGMLCTSIGGHEQDNVLEVRLVTLVVGKLGVVHHLKEDVVNIAVCLFNFVEQEHAVRCLANGVGEQTAIIITDVTRR